MKKTIAVILFAISVLPANAADAPPKLYNFTGLTPQEAQMIMQKLTELPWSQVNALMVKMNNQIIEQNNPTPAPTPTPTAPAAPK